MAVEGRYERKDRELNKSSTRSGATSQILCNKTIANRDSKSRLCKQFDETVEQIISACPIMAKEQYIQT